MVANISSAAQNLSNGFARLKKTENAPAENNTAEAKNNNASHTEAESTGTANAQKGAAGRLAKALGKMSMANNSINNDSTEELTKNQSVEVKISPEARRLMQQEAL
tara:strand:+ start:189 stop:506 length:318 start_codon:yes stop_codon:yes gene_type:complete